jgi:hypothetical protein
MQGAWLPRQDEIAEDRLVFGAEGLLLAGLAVVRPKIIAPAEHAESLFHTLLTFQL